MACYTRTINLYTVWPFVDTNPFKQESWMQVIDIFGQLRYISYNVSYMSYIIICTMCHHISMLLPKLHLSPTAQSLSTLHAWWQFPLHVVEGKWCACTEAAENLFKTFQQQVWRQQCKNPNLSSDFDFLL